MLTIDIVSSLLILESNTYSMKSKYYKATFTSLDGTTCQIVYLAWCDKIAVVFVVVVCVCFFFS